MKKKIPLLGILGLTAISVHLFCDQNSSYILNALIVFYALIISSLFMELVFKRFYE